jgi:hypothetical protein
VAISFFAYHQSEERRQMVIDHIATLCAQGLLANGVHEGDLQMGLIEALADGTYDLAAAHQNSGFTAPLLQICDGIFEGLPAEDAPPFALALVRAARIDANISDVPWDFLKWMFEDAVAKLGPSRIRSTAREAGHVFKQLSEMGGLTPTQQQRAKALAKKARRRGTTLPTAEEKFVAQALGTALDNSDQYANYAVYWIAKLAEQPTDQYRRYANKLLELVENT